MEQGYWYCPFCGVKVDPQDVTFEELHENCGHFVEWAEIDSVLHKTRWQRDRYKRILFRILDMINSENSFEHKILYCKNAAEHIYEDEEDNALFLCNEEIKMRDLKIENKRLKEEVKRYKDLIEWTKQVLKKRWEMGSK
jgi:hypothetical protein